MNHFPAIQTKRISCLLLAVSLLALCQATRAAYVADYASEVNAPAVSAALGWTYWYAVDGDMHNMSSLDQYWVASENRYNVTASPVFANVQGAASALPGALTPGDYERWVVARWTSDVASSWLNVAGTFTRTNVADHTEAVDLYVSLNGSTSYRLSLGVLYNDLTTHSYSINIPNVKIGDTIDLLVRAETHNWGDNLTLASTFTIPEPASFMLVSLAGLLMAQRRRR